MNHSVKILLIEDEALNAFCLEMELEQARNKVCGTAATGEEALTIFPDAQPDLVIADIHLAGNLDGIETAQQIQAMVQIPLIFITGYSDKGLRERAQAVHPIGYFMKPVSIQELNTAIQAVFVGAHV